MIIKSKFKKMKCNFRETDPIKGIMNQKLPDIYLRNGKECYLDPIRDKLIYITPEETIRQKAISYLINELDVPKTMIDVEQHLSHYGLRSNKRADIVVHKIDSCGNRVPLLIVECKASEIYLDDKAQSQVLDYCKLLNGCDYAMLVNGVSSLSLKLTSDTNEYQHIDKLPLYEEMLEGSYIPLEPVSRPKRLSFNELRTHLEINRENINDVHYTDYISHRTEMDVALPAFNLWQGLLDTNTKMPVGDYGMFELIHDYGIRHLTYGNSSGGKFYGPYRSFLVKVNGNVEFYSLGLSTYFSATHPNSIKTCLNVAHDDEKQSHHALQLVLDDNLVINGDNVLFYHSGKIGIGKGSGKIDELRMFVEEEHPSIVKGNRFLLGSLMNNRLWALNDDEVIALIVNLITYSIIRDKYRDYVKNR